MLFICCVYVEITSTSVAGLTNTHLKAPYSILLPISKACVDSYCQIIVHSARQNANAKQDKLDAQHARKASRQENANDDEANGLSVDVVAHVVEELVKNEVEEAQVRTTLILAHGCHIVTALYRARQQQSICT